RMPAGGQDRRLAAERADQTSSHGGGAPDVAGTRGIDRHARHLDQGRQLPFPAPADGAGVGAPHVTREAVLCAHHFPASGLIGEPTPPATGSGGAVKRNVQTPSPAQSSASASRSNISPSVRPMSRMQSA